MIEPLAGPRAVGAKLTLATQVELGGMLEVHVVEARTNGPLSVKGDRGTEVAAGLLIVKSWTALRLPVTTEPKSWPMGVIVAGGTGVPLPDSDTFAVPELATNASVPAAGPEAAGVKRASTEQLEFAARLVPQVLAMIWNGPLTVTLVTDTDTGAGFAKENVNTGLVVPASKLPKSWLVGAAVGGEGAIAVPLRVTGRGLPAALSQM
jgi:hypothetical protein